jgi:predicted nucleotidyltransferase
MKFGLTKNQYDYLKNTLKVLTDKGVKIWCFGSRATGKHNPYSDVDLLVEGDLPNINIALSKINEILEEGNFPYKVDIVLDRELANDYRCQINIEKISF